MDTIDANPKQVGTKRKGEGDMEKARVNEKKQKLEEDMVMLGRMKEKNFGSVVAAKQHRQNQGVP